jgi:hypothetical protein
MDKVKKSKRPPFLYGKQARDQKNAARRSAKKSPMRR